MSWISPLGLPVLQPYRQKKTQTIKTRMQTITLALDDDTLPVSKSKQRTAFPPNFVHSLDASHMLITSLKMKEKGLTFAAVHDSYWTHACDVETMNEVNIFYFDYFFEYHYYYYFSFINLFINSFLIFIFFL